MGKINDKSHLLFTAKFNKNSVDEILKQKAERTNNNVELSFSPEVVIPFVLFLSCIARIFTDQTTPKPPKLGINTLFFLLPRDHRDEIMADLDEDYVTNIVPKLGEQLARRWYWFQVARTSLHYNGVSVRLIKLVETFQKGHGS